MFDVDAIVDAAFAEAGSVEPSASKEPPRPSDYEKVARELEQAASEVTDEKTGETGDLRLKKLAMITILDTVEDPKARPCLEKLAAEIVEAGKVAFESPQPTQPGTVGELGEVAGAGASDIVVKQKIDHGRTLFQKLKEERGAKTEAK